MSRYFLIACLAFCGTMPMIGCDASVEQIEATDGEAEHPQADRHVDEAVVERVGEDPDQEQLRRQRRGRQDDEERRLGAAEAGTSGPVHGRCSKPAMTSWKAT